MKNAEHKVDNLMTSSEDKRFMALHRWLKNVREHTRLVKAGMDVRKLYSLSDGVVISPCCWREETKFIKGKYKIIYLITNCKNTGPMNQTLNIIKNLDRNMFEPVVVTLFDEEPGNSVVQKFLNLISEFYCLKISKVDAVINGRKKLSALLDVIKPDLIHSVGMPPYKISLGYKDAVHFVTIRNYCYEDYPDRYGKITGTILAHRDMRVISHKIRIGEIFVTCSKSLSQIYKEKHGIELAHICNGVDAGRYTKKSCSNNKTLRDELVLPNDRIIFVYSGIFVKRKNQIEAINAFINMKKRNRAVLLLLGDGSEFNEIKDKYNGNSDVIFRGSVTNVNEYLNASDIYLSTSKSEGMPNGVLEAMACGLPVVLSDIPQHMEILEKDNKCGMSYNLGNVAELTDILDMMLDKNLNEMGDRSNKVVMDNFTDDIMSKHYQSLYSTLIEKRVNMKMNLKER